MANQLTPTQTALVEQCVPRVASLARALAPRIPHASFDELQSAGYEGLVQAALRYDPASGVPFSAFAHYRVRGAMIDAARRAAPEIRRRSRAMRALTATQALLEQAQSQTTVAAGLPDPRTLRERVEAAAAVVAQTATAVVLSKLAPADPDKLGTDPSHSAEETLAHAQELAQLRTLVAQCSPAERALLDALYIEGHTMHEYAATVGKSVSTVSRHHAKLVQRLGVALGRDRR